MLAKSLIQDFPYSFLVYIQLVCLAITPVRRDQINITDAEKFIWKVVDSINNTVSKMLLVSCRVMGHFAATVQGNYITLPEPKCEGLPQHLGCVRKLKFNL